MSFKVVLLSIHMVLSICAVIWCVFFRSVTQLLEHIESTRKVMN